MSDTDESTWLGLVLVERPIHSTDYLLRGAGILLITNITSAIPPGMLPTIAHG